MNNKPTTKDVFLKEIQKNIYAYDKEFGSLIFTVKFNSGIASALIIDEQKSITLKRIHAKKNMKVEDIDVK